MLEIVTTVAVVGLLAYALRQGKAKQTEWMRGVTDAQAHVEQFGLVSALDCFTRKFMATTLKHMSTVGKLIYGRCKLSFRT